MASTVAVGVEVATSMANASIPSANASDFFSKLPTYIDVNYTRLFQIDQRPDSQEDCCIFVHTNNLCVLTLAPSHPLHRLQQTPIGITFQMSDGTDRAQSQAQGHRKKGAQLLTPGSCICHIDCADGTRYDVTSAMKGKLLEINSRLTSMPHLLIDKPFSTGYLAIIMPNELEIISMKKSMHSEQMYRELRYPV